MLKLDILCLQLHILARRTNSCVTTPDVYLLGGGATVTKIVLTTATKNGVILQLWQHHPAAAKSSLAPTTIVFIPHGSATEILIVLTDLTKRTAR